MSVSAGSVAISARPDSALSARRHASTTRSSSCIPTLTRSSSPSRAAASAAAYSSSERTGGRLSTTSRTAAIPTSVSRSATVGYGVPASESLWRWSRSSSRTAGRASASSRRDAEPVPGLRLVLAAEDAEADRRALVDEGGEAAHLVPGAGLRERPLQRAERPRGLAGRRPPAVSGDRGHRGVEAGPQRRLEGLEVLAARLLRTLVVDDAEGRAQVLGHLLPVPRLARDDDALRRAHVAARARRAAARRRAAPRRGSRARCWVRAPGRRAGAWAGCGSGWSPAPRAARARSRRSRRPRPG